MGTPREVADGVFRLEVFTPFGTGPTNAYLLRGERLGLFDTGLRHPTSRDDLMHGLASLGVTPEQVEVVAVSHGHIDHYGLAGAFPNARVLMGRRDLHKLTDVAGHVAQYTEVVAQLLAAWAVPDHLNDAIVGSLQDIVAMAGSVPGAEPAAQGDRLEGLGSGVWTVQEFPGHTEGLVGLYRETDRVLLASDHLLPHITPNPGLYTLDEPPRSGLSDYVTSLERALRLGPRLILPGHGLPFTDVEDKVAGVLAHHAERLDVIRRTLGDGSAIYPVVVTMFPGEAPHHVFLAAREVYGHLQILEAQGRVSRQSTYDGLDLYRAA